MHVNDSSVDVSCLQRSQARPKIIFIASLSHSGSTLLDLMLTRILMWCPWAKLSSSVATGAQQGHAGDEPDAHAELKASAHVHSGVWLARYRNLEPGRA